MRVLWTLVLGLPLLAGCAQVQGPYGAAPTAAALPAPASADVIFVSHGETVYDIAKRYKVPLRDLIDGNRLAPPYVVTPGQRLILPRPREYKVQSGDTVYGISRRYQVDMNELVRLNDIAAPYTIRVGQVLRIPGQRDAGRAVAAATGTPPATVSRAVPVPPHRGASVQSEELPPPNRAAPGRPPDVQPGVRTGGPQGIEVEVLPPPGEEKAVSEVPPVAVSPAASSPSVPGTVSVPATAGIAPAASLPSVSPAPPPRQGRGFLMPVNGPILSGFGPKEGGLHNDGINIGAPRGTPVLAAESGVVAYAGNELRGFGNLLLIKHADGWVTAYAHLEEFAVDRGQTVARGQRIGTVGQSGNVRAPQLHFEVRRGSQAIDPRNHMASAADPAGAIN